MTRSVLRRTALLALICSAISALPAAAKKDPPPPAPVSDEVKVVGEIVDCSEYMVLGFKGGDRRFIQSKNIDSGAPACLIADGTSQVYLLVSISGPARMKFQPTENFLGGGTVVEGTVFNRGNLKALSITNVSRVASPQRNRLTAPEPKGIETLGAPGSKP